MMNGDSTARDKAQLPAKPLEVILRTEDGLLTDQERLIKQNYLMLQNADDTIQYKPQILNMKVVRETGQMLMPGGETVKEVQGIIFYSALKRESWKEGNEQVLWCQSFDLNTGRPTDDGKEHISFMKDKDMIPCLGCPHNTWYEKDGRNVRDCKEKRILYVINRSGILRLKTPPSSSSVWDEYVSDCKSKKKSVATHITHIGVDGPMKSKGGFDYSMLSFKLGDPIPTDMVNEVMAATEALKTHFNSFENQLNIDPKMEVQQEAKESESQVNPNMFSKEGQNVQDDDDLPF